MDIGRWQSIGNSPLGMFFRWVGNFLLGNYTAFDTTGHQTMHGNARPWVDEIGDALSLRVQGPGLSATSTLRNMLAVNQGLLGMTYCGCTLPWCS